MEVSSINNLPRQEIYDYISKKIRNGSYIRECCDSLRDLLYESQSKDFEPGFSHIKEKREQIIMVAYLDALKMTFYKHKIGLVNEKELIFYNNLNAIESPEELIAETSADFDLLSDIFLQAYNYITMNEFSKSIIMKSLSNDENQFLCETYKIHLFDLLVYCKEITINDLVDYYSKLIKFEKKNLGEELDDNNITIVSSYLQNLLRFDRDNALNLICELGSIDYSVSKYLNNLIESDYLLDHIDFYENYSLNDIIYRLSTDQLFFKDAVWMFKSLYIDKKYDDIDLDLNILDTEDTKKVYRKLMDKLKNKD